MSLQRTAAASGREKLIELLLLACGVLSILTTSGIVLVLGVESAPFFLEVGPAAFLGDTQWTPLFAQPRFGIWPLVGGTLLTTGIAVLVAGPTGMLAAIYLSEFAPNRVRGLLKPMLELLAGVPTVVYGYFALTAMTPVLQQVVPGLAGFNALSAGVIMGVMIVPMVSSLTEDALYSVPRSLKEGAWALGAGSLTTLFQVTLPAARSGILAAFTLAISRAIGETMIVAIAAGQQPRLTLDPRVPIETMTAFIVQVSMGDTPAGTLAWRTLFAVGACLFVMTLGMNLSARRFATASGRDL